MTIRHSVLLSFRAFYRMISKYLIIAVICITSGKDAAVTAVPDYLIQHLELWETENLFTEYNSYSLWLPDLLCFCWVTCNFFFFFLLKAFLDIHGRYKINFTEIFTVCSLEEELKQQKLVIIKFTANRITEEK